MIVGGNATVMVSDFNRAVEFYTKTLGLKLANRFDNEWAEVSAGEGLTIGIHPGGGHGPKPGTAGSISIGFTIRGPIDDAIATLKSRGVQFHGPVLDRPEEGIKLAFFGDPDGNALYLCEVTKSWSGQP